MQSVASSSGYAQFLIRGDTENLKDHGSLDHGSMGIGSKNASTAISAYGNKPKAY
jgi:hypothetical protein